MIQGFHGSLPTDKSVTTFILGPAHCFAEVVTDNDRLSVPLFVSGDSHKSLFSGSGVVPGWMCRAVAKNPTLTYAFESMSMEKLWPQWLQDLKIFHEGGEQILTVPYLTNNAPVDGEELTRPVCPKVELDAVLQFGYKAVISQTVEDKSATRPKAPKRQQHLLR